jgi:hypothetical protein
MDDEIEQMKHIYKTVEDFYISGNFTGMDEYLVSLMDANVNFQLCTAALLITKDVDCVLVKRNTFLGYTVDRAKSENIPDDIMTDALNGIA